MTGVFRIRCLPAAVLLPVVLLASGCTQAVGDAYTPVAAVVDGARIFEEEVLTTIRLNLDEQTKVQIGGDGRAQRIHKAERDVLGGLIATQVLANQAPKRGVTVSEAEIDEGIERLQERLGSEERFIAALRAAGTTLDGLRHAFRKELLAGKVQDSVITGVVPEAELRTFYDQQKAFFDEQVHVLHILVCSRSDPATGACVEAPEDADVAASLSKRAREGADFADLVRRFSTDKGSNRVGGDLGWLDLGGTPPEFAAAVSALRPGDISGPVRTVLGVHVVKLVARGRSFEQARAEIEQATGGDRLQAALDAFVKDAIEASSIRVNPRFGRFDPKTQSVVTDAIEGR